MGKITIKNIKFEDICQLTKTEYPWVNADTLIKQCEFLKKVTVLDDTVRIDNPLGRFLYLTVEETRFSADYTEATRKFIQSNYVSSIIKKYIYNLFKHFSIQGEAIETLNSDIPLNEFSASDLRTIKMELDKLFVQVKMADEMYNNIYDMFDDYMLALDGEGPKEYVNITFGKSLPIELLKHSGLNNVPSKYPGNRVQRYLLCENQLMSLYKKFDKYMPEHKEAFIKLVKSIDRLSAANFITYFNKFVEHNFTIDFIKDEKSMPLEEVAPAATAEEKLSAEAIALDDKREAMSHAITVKNFLEKVFDYEFNKPENSMIFNVDEKKGL